MPKRILTSRDPTLFSKLLLNVLTESLPPNLNRSVEAGAVWEGNDPGDTRIISDCRVSKANDGGAGADKSISRGTESQVFRGRAAGKRMRTRSSGKKANQNPCLVDFLTSEGIAQLPLSDFLESSLLRRWQSFADARAHAVTKARNSTAGRTDRLGMTGHSGE